MKSKAPQQAQWLIFIHPCIYIYAVHAQAFLTFYAVQLQPPFCLKIASIDNIEQNLYDN